jgi:hypothetical protein
MQAAARPNSSAIAHACQARAEFVDVGIGFQRSLGQIEGVAHFVIR